MELLHGLPANASAESPAVDGTPWSPFTPIPGGIVVHLCSQGLLVRQVPLLLVTTVLAVGLLRTNV